MNSFEHVCENCPLRTKVNLQYATETDSMGSGGVNAYLSDGENSYTVNVWPGSVEDSDQTAAAWALLDRDVDKCDGPTQGLLRQRCAAGLASAWRWSNVIGSTAERPTDTLEKIKGSIVPSTADEALSSTLTESTWIVGDAEDFVGLPMFSPYFRNGYFKTTRTLKGQSANLKKGSVFALDDVFRGLDSTNDGETVYHLKFFNGPSFHFAADGNEFVEDRETFLARAIHKLLMATPEELQQSESYGEEVWRKHHESQQRLEQCLGSGELLRDLKNVQRVIPQDSAPEDEQEEWPTYPRPIEG